MKNNDSHGSGVVRLPQLQVHLFWKRIISRVRRVRLIYWVIAIILLLALFISLKPEFMWEYFWPKIEAQGHFLTLVLIFSFVAVSLVWKKGQSIDVWVFNLFNRPGERPAWFDKLMLALTQLGSSAFAFVLAGLYLILGKRHLGYEIILGTLVLWLMVELIKILVRRTRPYIKLKKIRIVGSRARGHSFPSGHTSQAFYLANMLLHYYQADFFGALALYALALTVGVTRIYVGMHYPRDVLGGAILGTGWGILSMIVNSYFQI
ncbi:MAG: phosphatase PAP2 family protein [Clostridia bacterium]|nr:phosphatase PAP2 family protein [Clostridia bacterium]